MTPKASELSEYLRLLKVGESLKENTTKLPEVRLALLGNHATQQLHKVLAATFFEKGFYPVIYEGGFNTASFEVFDESSELYQFKPEFVYLSVSVQNYRDRFYDASVALRETLAETFVAELETQALALKEKGISVLINTLALPTERMFGNYSAFTNHSLYGSVLSANHLLIAMAKKHSGVYLNDIQYLAAQIGARQFFDEKLWTLSKYLCSNKYLPEIALNAVNTVLATRGRITKALVLDLDNTLWGGVIGDDGVEGIALSDAGAGEAFYRFQKYLSALKDRGYVLSVCSKNEEAAACIPFDSHPSMVLKKDDISVFVANWNDKASNISFIAKTLNLGPDSFVFIDDSAFERGQVRSTLPEVLVPEMVEEPADYVRCLEQLHLFETLSFSEEDRKRSDLYSQEAKRTTERIKFGSIDDYLKSLDMGMKAQRFVPENIPRIAQLIQRSNQFNLRTQRISQSQCEERMRDNDHFFSLSFSVSDKFGDYGLIGVICADYEADALFVTELVMSCRVLKRGVEQYMMNTLVEECQRKGLKYLKGEYLPTKKNALVREFYDQFGFERQEHESGVRYRLDVSRYVPFVTYFKEENT